MASKLKAAKGNGYQTTTTLNNIRVTKNMQTIAEKIPKGSEILRKDVSISIEQISNGFITSKTYDIKYKTPGSDNSDYCYHTDKFYTEENPIQVSSTLTADADGDGKSDNKSGSVLADMFEDD